MRVLAAVHEHDDYPTRWPADAAGWLSPTGIQGAWVAEVGGATSYAAEQELGLVLDVVDTARSSAIALYERLGWQLVGYRAASWVTADGVRRRLRLYVLP